MSYLVFGGFEGFEETGGIDSRDYDVMVFEKNSFNAPYRDISVQSVPGKNGDVLIDNGKYKNIVREFDCIVYVDAIANLVAFRDAMCAKVGYQKIETDIHPDEFFMGYMARETEVKIDDRGQLAKFKLSFNCKPQSFLRSGENTYLITESSETIQNPTNQIALPQIRVHGAGTFEIGSVSCTISQADGYTDIDCETMICKKGTTPKGQYVSFSQYEYPKLYPGDNGIVFGGGITSIEIIPRWYRL